MITRSEIREAELPRTASRTLDHDNIVCTYRLTTTRTYAGTDGAGEALYDEEREVELLSMILRFGERVADAVVIMPSELSDDRRAAIEEQIKRAIVKGM